MSDARLCHPRYGIKTRALVNGRRGTIVSHPRPGNGYTYGIRFDDGLIEHHPDADIEPLPGQPRDASEDAA